jgi:predicted  nucleic acid-binding Zn-ribbon protein
MSKHCLHCGLRFSDSTAFCPNCGRPTESGFSVRPMQESGLERLGRESKEKDELIRQLVLALTMPGEASRAAAQPAERSGNCDSDGRWASTTVRSSGRS